MLTYVINTSENKTLDSDTLFKLVGYSKIRWMNYGLRDLEKCADEICDLQTTLGADDFRVVLLVDFYGFDRIRSVYGSDGYSVTESGVDLSVYFPILEAYMVDHLFARIRRKELTVQEKHVFYIQGDSEDGFNVIDNKEKQLKYILEPDEDSVIDATDEEPEFDSEKARQNQLYIVDSKQNGNAQTDAETSALADETEEENTKNDNTYDKNGDKRYSRFILHCTNKLSLDIKINDYPYTNLKGLSFHEFYLAFKLRESQYNGMIRHHFHASFGSGPAKAAFDNLSLSLYIIKLYERDEPIRERNEFVVDTIDPDKLKKLLIDAWNKVCSARTIALKNSSEYYDLESIVSEKPEEMAESARQAKTFSRAESRNKARAELKKLSVEKIYSEIREIASEDSDTFSERDKKELDKLMSAYLVRRDETKESEATYEFKAMQENCAKTNQCPSQNDFENVVTKKKNEIAALLNKTIEVEYINKDYTEERKTADKAYVDYVTSKQNLDKRFGGDIAMWILSVIVMLIPFVAVRRMDSTALFAYLLTAALFTGLFLIAFSIRVFPLIYKMKRAKKQLKMCYCDCRVKQDLALLNYKIRYESDLIKIENLRYDLRNITQLHKSNREKNHRIEEHRQRLEVVEDKLSSILNNLGIEPTVMHYNDLTDEFDVNKSLNSNSNKIYKIFSLDAIENLFGGKER